MDFEIEVNIIKMLGYLDRLTYFHLHSFDTSIYFSAYVSIIIFRHFCISPKTKQSLAYLIPRLWFALHEGRDTPNNWSSLSLFVGTFSVVHLFVSSEASLPVLPIIGAVLSPFCLKPSLFVLSMWRRVSISFVGVVVVSVSRHDAMGIIQS